MNPSPGRSILTALLLTSWLGASALSTTADDSAVSAVAGKAGSTNAAPGIAPGHSLHGEWFDDGPRQAAVLMKGMPAIRFPVTTTNAEAQEFFTQGVGQLHGFWYFEAERSFRQAGMLDTNCAMAYWGMAMANVNNTNRAAGFIQQAVDRKARASRREGMWIEALAAYYREKGKAEKDRRRDLVRALEDLVNAFPDDLEAKAFLGYQAVWNHFHDVPISSAQSVEALLREVFAADPMHPAHHYRIHLWDGEGRDEVSVRALESAARCGPSAPGIAHMWHMPGHTYSRLKRYQDMAWQQEAALRVDNAQIVAQRILPDQIFNYAHNSEWFCETLGRVGRVHDLVALARNMIEMPHHPRFNALEKKEDNTFYEAARGAARQGRRRLLEELVRYELWDELITLAGGPYLPATDIAEEQARRAHALGLAYVARGKLELGRQQITALEQAARVMRAERQAAVDQAEANARKAKEPTEKINQAMLEVLNSYNDRVQAFDKQAAELKAWAALAEDQPDEAKRWLEHATEMTGERKAQMFLRLGDAAKAETLAREAMTSKTNQVQAIANCADILWRAGKTNEAAEVFQALRSLSCSLDLDMPVFQRLAPIAQSLGLPQDWRAAAVRAADIGERPDLETLGPFLWTPGPAPDWTLPGSSGASISLRDYRRRPVLVVFYLGHSCAHCIEQLNALSPVARDFTAAGIAIVAVSTETVEGLKETFAKVKGTELPFPLVSDAGLGVFKAYRAYDDFEGQPLHGTFLVDAGGLVRWQDISYEPFTEVTYLLKEAKRLLSFPAPAGARGHKPVL
jgi:peroxiredoxin